MFSLKYTKQYSFKNKNSDANNKVIEKLIQLSCKSTKENSMRITLINRGTFHFPYSLTLKREEINEDRANLEIVIQVEMMKLLLLSLISSTLIFAILYLVFDARWLSFMALIYGVLIYQIGRKKIIFFTEKMVSNWFKGL